MIISKTPLRISFFGGGTDLPDFFKSGRGAVLGSAIDKYIYVAINRFYGRLFDYRLRLAYRLTECVNHASQLQHRPASVILSEVGLEQDVEITLNADLPAFSGLGSSSSFTVGLYNAALSFKGLNISPGELTRLSIHTERTLLHESVGCQDQTFASYGGLRVIEFFPHREPVVSTLSISQAIFDELNESVLLFFTGIKRRAQDLESKKISNIEVLRPTFNRMLADVDSAVDLLQSKGDVEAFGRLLRQSWELKRSLDPDVSSPTIDFMYQEGIRAGAFGGKLLGAGGGGFMMFICPLVSHSKLRLALADFIEIPVRLGAEGSKIIHDG